MVPSAMHVAVLRALRESLLPSLDALAETLAGHARSHAATARLGRTHLQDAVPMALGEEFGAWRAQLLAAREALLSAMAPLRRLAVGGTAVGSGLNGHPDFAREVCAELSARAGEAFEPADNGYAAQSNHDPLLLLHGALRTLATALFKLGNDVRLLASGPRAGIGELLLPANEPGSSIMPGKVNPTQCEALVMVCCQIFGNDTALTWGAAGGQLQLNACKPLIIANVLDSIELAAGAMASFDIHALRGLRADEARLAANLERSLMLATALVPHLGYDRAARIARQALEQGTGLREAALAQGVDGADFDRWVQPRAMARPFAAPSTDTPPDAG
jgi:fumarate hydratase class II